ncbi:MAG: 5'-methylthioadenosine/S-adenosylhomocysteine nucleosidase [Stenomitos rutilans HA7619-LM2]|nr:5'-methylthioadenosine/S-adenosylhomocysteine nucleosidase [Stenomitos rutilans HA7619-LM2]
MSASRIRRICIIALLCLVMTIAQVSAKEAKPKRCLTECKSRLGIVSAFGEEATILLAETSNKREYRINGNIFTTGKLRGNRVVIVLSGVSIENATMITQLMVDNFSIHHLLLSGIAGGIDPDSNIGDVVVPSKWAFPLEVYWSGDSSVPAPCGTPGDLLCLGLKLSKFTSTTNSDYQIPTPGGAVGTGLFMRDTFVRNDSNFPNGEYKFDYKVDPEMLAVAKSVNAQLDRCGPKNPSLCVSKQPVVRIGGRGVAGPAFLANPNYRDYIFKTIKAVSVDMETTALAHVAYANEIPFIAFRSLSDLAGGDDFTDVGAFFGSGLAEGNESKVTLGFLEAWAKQHPDS